MQVQQYDDTFFLFLTFLIRVNTPRVKESFIFEIRCMSQLQDQFAHTKYHRLGDLVIITPIASFGDKTGKFHGQRLEF